MRLQNTSLRGQTTHTAWGKLHFDNDGIAHVDDEEAHAELSKVDGFTDPDAPAKSVLDARGNEEPNIKHIDLVHLEAALTDAHDEVRRMSADIHARTDQVSRLQADNQKLEAEVARLRHEAAATQQGNQNPISEAERERHDRTAEELQRLKLEHKALKEENHRLKQGAVVVDKNSEDRSPAIGPNNPPGRATKTDAEPAPSARKHAPVPGTANPDVPGSK